MKKVALLLAAAMLALAGCASAGDTAAASEAAPAEVRRRGAAAEDSTEAALPGEPHSLSAYKRLRGQRQQRLCGGPPLFKQRGQSR